MIRDTQTCLDPKKGPFPSFNEQVMQVDGSSSGSKHICHTHCKMIHLRRVMKMHATETFL